MNFIEVFQQEPTIEASAPGRVNLLGEHTDYNDGFVLPTAIPQHTIVQVAVSDKEHHHFYSADLKSSVTSYAHSEPPKGFASYIYGCIKLIEAEFHAVPWLNLYVSSTVPMGSGLSSSAALEVAILRALRSLLDLDIDDVRIAQIAQQAEIRYAGVNCGIMDQMASSLADTEHMLFLDTRSLLSQVLPLPTHAEIVVIDSGVPRTLATSGYNQRRSECEAAAKALEVTALRDVTDIAALKNLPEPLQRRARHVVTENQRVLEAKEGVSAQRFGELMNDSHASLQKDYEVSIPALDRLVGILQDNPKVLGARLTGAGFGGACVALVETGEGKQVAKAVLELYDQSDRHHQGKILVPAII